MLTIRRYSIVTTSQQRRITKSVMVCDERNQRDQVFELSGKFVTKFGSKGVAKVESLGIQYVQQILEIQLLTCAINLRI